jgi:hypothetical protein
MAKAVFSLALILLAAACSHRNGDIHRTLAAAGNEVPKPELFYICHAHGCTKRTRVSLTPEQWGEIREIFADTAAPEDERRRLRSAIAKLEVWAGEQTGTGRDIGGSFRGFGRKGQMDCIDEMVNTATYIRMMERGGLLKHHRLDSREYLGFFQTRFWPHAAAAIRETAADRRWIVDSWWHANGTPPYVVTYEEWWKGGWRERYDAMDREAAAQASESAS